MNHELEHPKQSQQQPVTPVGQARVSVLDYIRQYLLDPIDSDDVNLLAFDEEGKAIPAPKTSEWEKCRVDETIQRLKLNEHEALTEERRKVWNRVNRAVEQYKTAKARCTNGGNPAAKQKLHESVKYIKSLTRHDAELSAVAKWCLLFRNDPQLSRLI